MPQFHHRDADLHYDLHGEGPPLLLITGLGLGRWSWYRQVETLASRFRVVTFDNRGAGESSATPGPYSVATLANDALALMDHLRLEAAHVLGISMGGYIAQTLAVEAPHRVRSLVLGCTAFGGDGAVRMSDDDFALLRSEADSGFSADACQRALPLRFSERCLRTDPQFVDDFVMRRTANAASAEGWWAQVAACASFDLSDRLSEVRCPTLITTGDSDRIVPSINTELLLTRIKGAEVVRPRGGHLFFIEDPEPFNTTAIDFLLRHSTPGSERA